MMETRTRSCWMGVCALFIGALLLAAVTAPAGVDLLELPAKKSPHAAYRILLGVATAGKRLVAVGDRGIITYSDDQGQTWGQADVPVSVMLTAVYFVNEQTGWAVGHDGVVLRTVDGGKTWIKQFDGNKGNALVRANAEARVQKARSALESAGGGKRTEVQRDLERAESFLQDSFAGEKFGPSRPLLGVWFRDTSNGFVVGSYGQIFRTSNGGDSWEYAGQKVNNPEGLHYNAITAGRSGFLLMAGEAGKVYRSSDSGESWQISDTGYKGQLYGVLEAGEKKADDILLTFGFGGRIFRSTNHGGIWEQVGAGLKSVAFIAGVRLESGTILLAAQDGSVLSSRDQGRTFAVVAGPGHLPIAAMAQIPGTQPAVALAGMGGVRVLALGTTTSGAGHP